MTQTEKEIIEEIFNDLITERWVKPDWLQYKDELIGCIQRILNEGRKQLVEEIIPMINKNNIGEVPRAIVLDEIKEKLQKEAEK